MGWGRAPLAHLALLSAGGFGLEAHAGAWTPEDKHGQSITSLSYDHGKFGTKWRVENWIDYGFAGGWAMNFKVESEHASGIEQSSRTSYGLGVQKSFKLGERAAIGAQASLLAGEALDGPVCEGEGRELRVMAGTSFSLSGREGFVNLEAARRERGSLCRRNVVEASAGLDFAPKWRGMVKAWREEEDGRLLTSKAEAAIYREFKDYTIGLGYREETSGRFEESGVVLVYWTRY